MKKKPVPVKKLFPDPPILRKTLPIDKLGLETSKEEEDLVNKRKSVRHSSMTFRKSVSLVFDNTQRKLSGGDGERSLTPRGNEEANPKPQTPRSSVQSHPLAMMGVDFVYEEK